MAAEKLPTSSEHSSNAKGEDLVDALGQSLDDPASRTFADES